MADRPKLDEFVVSPAQMRKEARKKLKSQDIWDALRGEDGDDGVSITEVTIDETGNLIVSFSDGKTTNAGFIKGEKGDKPTKEELVALIKPLVPKVKDGHTPTQEELLDLILPLIPSIEEREEYVPDSPDQIVEKVNSATTKIKQEAVDGLPEAFKKQREEVTRDIKNATSRALSGGNTNIRIKQNGTPKGQVETLNFTNATITPVGNGLEANVTVSGGSSPLTTKGDIYTYSSADARLPVGADGTVLMADSAQTTGVKWGTVSGTGTVTSVASADGSVTVTNGTTAADLAVVKAPKLTTARTIDGQSFDGTANVTVIAPGTHAATGKTTPIDADELPLVDTAASNVLKKVTWANVKATLKTYFDTLYPSGSGTSSGTNTGDQTITLTGDVTGSGTGTFAATAKNNLKLERIQFSIDGGGSAITTGQKGTYPVCVYAGTITAYNITVDTGTCTVKFWKKATGTAIPTVADVINTSGVAISTGTAVRSTTTSDFTTTSVAANDIFALQVTAVSGVTKLFVSLEITRT